MKSYRKELWFNVPGRRAFINITPQVNRVPARQWNRRGLGVGKCHAHNRVCFH